MYASTIFWYLNFFIRVNNIKANKLVGKFKEYVFHVHTLEQLSDVKIPSSSNQIYIDVQMM